MGDGKVGVEALDLGVEKQVGVDVKVTTYETSLRDLSTENLSRWKSEFVQQAIEKGMYSDEDAVKKAIEEERGVVEEGWKLTVNLAPASIKRLFATGRQETFWDHLKDASALEEMRRAETAQGKSITAE